MTLTELRYIVTLAEEQHFGRSAARCHVSQPTLSVAVRKLEESLGVVLFERSKTCVKPTALGEQLVIKARNVLATVQHIKTLADAGRDQLGSPLALGAIFTVGPYLLPQLIPHLHKQVPGMPLRVHEDYTENLRRKLQAGALDVILVSLPFNDGDVVTQELFEEPLVVILPSSHALAHKQEIALDDLRQQRLVMMGEGHCLREQVRAICPEPAATMGIAQPEANSLETLRYMVAAGLGLSIVPLSAASPGMCQAQRLVARPLAAPSSQRRLALAWRASFPRHRAIDVLRKAIQTCSGAYWNFTTEPEENVQTMLSLR
jgi:LysR family hydrogen peroxide-inducible transcriptional activator